MQNSINDGAAQPQSAATSKAFGSASSSSRNSVFDVAVFGAGSQAVPIRRQKAAKWSNWSGLQQSVSRETLYPRSHAEVLAVMQTANEQGRKVKPVGSGHSFTAAAIAADIRLDLTELSGIVALDPQKQQVTLHSGTKLWQIPALLRGSGLAMQNLGDINAQSISGAVSTSTHGTGLKFGGLGSQVAALKMVTGDGKELTVDASDPELLDALRVTVGGYGVLTELTLQLVPDFDLAVSEELANFHEVLASWEERCNTNDHFEFFWFPAASQVITKTSARVAPHTLPRTSQGRIKTLLTEEVLNNGVFAALCQAGRFVPQLTPRLNRLATAGWGKVQYVKNWSAGFASPRRVRFNEMEYAVPFAAVPEILTAIKTAMTQRGITSTFPLEVRAAAADTGWLATNHGRKTGYIAIHQHISQDFNEYFGVVEDIFKAYEGRPHWGKLHNLEAANLAELYPRWQDAQRLRNKLDPARTLENAYTRQIFGA